MYGYKHTRAHMHTHTHTKTKKNTLVFSYGLKYIKGLFGLIWVKYYANLMFKLQFQV